MKLQSYKDLIVWQKSIELVIEIYNLTRLFPKSEVYGLVSQMRRAAIAIPSNIAEGYRRKHIKEYIQFLYVANGSASELETQIDIARKLEETIDLDYSKCDNLIAEVLKMLNVLIAKLETKRYPLHPIP
ncbi:MAG: four helix bundle protein [Candidatus Omnitrophica bacterium]|nr:four helix bundle protein [Candidatus Omnitrophota bacterium]HOX54045.1 four helix bundle protein [Candidatus Omnitrophota bacterium]